MRLFATKLTGHLRRMLPRPLFAAFLVFALCAVSGSAYAIGFGQGSGGTDVTTISENIVKSSELLPGLITAVSYLLALLFGALGIMKMKEHVEAPHQVQLKEPMIRFIAGGALLALPIVYEAMANTIGSGEFGGVAGSAGFSVTGLMSGILGRLSSWMPGGAINFNKVLSNIADSFEGVPGILTAVSYLLGLVLGVAAILKLKEHVESPQNTPLREPVVRFLLGGALFSLPTVFSAMKKTIEGDGAGFFDVFGNVANSIGILLGMKDCGPSSVISSLTGGLGGALGQLGGKIGGGLGGKISGLAGKLPGGAGGQSMSDVICNMWAGTAVLPGFLSAAAYLFGIVLGIWGLLKVKDHVLNPQQTSIWEPIARLIAGGAFFALPAVLGAARNTIGALLDMKTSNFSGGVSGGGLDAMMVAFVTDIYGPMVFLINWFGYVAGVILVMIGISRLLKSAQEGPRGPGGLGTIMTFLAGGAFLSFGPMVAMMGSTLFNSPITEVAPALTYTNGMENNAIMHTQTVIHSILQFMIILGMISFARGLFIIRGVAEGNQQASMMAGVTHIVGGAMAVNLGPVLNAVQTTLGLTGYGVVFY